MLKHPLAGARETNLRYDSFLKFLVPAFHDCRLRFCDDIRYLRGSIFVSLPVLIGRHSSMELWLTMTTKRWQSEEAQKPASPMKSISVLALGGFIALFGLTRIGAAADSRDNNASVSKLLGTNSGEDSFFPVTYPRSARFDTGVESKEDSKRVWESYKWKTPGTSEYDRKARLNPLTLYTW